MSLPSKQRQKAVATGTDDKQLTRKWTPKRTPKAYPVCNQSALNVNRQSIRPEKHQNHKHLEAGRLDANKEDMSPSVIGKKQIRLEGLEPPTFGSVDRRSIQLSYRRK